MMEKILTRVIKALYNYFVRCYMSDEEWKSYLDAKRNPVWMQYKHGCVYLYKNKNDKDPFRIIKNGKIILEEKERNEGIDNGK